MKKVLSLVAILGALAGTASAAPYYMTAPAGGQLTPYDWQPVYSIEGVYSFVDDLPDTYGARLNFSLYNNAESTVRHQFGVSLGYETGHGHIYAMDERVKIDTDRIPLTANYDLNIAITDYLMIDLGAKAGYAWGIVDGPLVDRFDIGGFTFSLGAGIKVQCSETLYVKVGYEFTRTFYKDSGDKLNVNQNSIIAGIGCTF